MNITYGKGWFRAKKRLTEPWNEDKARDCHAKRTLYVAVVSDESSPICFIESNMDYIGVGFLDSMLREYLCYQFQERTAGQLFLSMAIHREYDGNTDKVIKGTSYGFEEDGHVSIKEQDFESNTISTAERHADVSSNWDAYPEFGRYDSIIRKDRE